MGVMLGRPTGKPAAAAAASERVRAGVAAYHGGCGRARRAHGGIRIGAAPCCLSCGQAGSLKHFKPPFENHFCFQDCARSVVLETLCFPPVVNKTLSSEVCGKIRTQYYYQAHAAPAGLSVVGARVARHTAGAAAAYAALAGGGRGRRTWQLPWRLRRLFPAAGLHTAASPRPLLVGQHARRIWRSSRAR